jgi:hypothetical protein
MPRDFTRRFHLKVELPDAQLRFINRALNLIFEGFKWNHFDTGTQNNLDRQIASALGLRHIYRMSMEKYIEGDFLKCLQALEAFYKGVIPFILVQISFFKNSNLDSKKHWKGPFRSLKAPKRHK